MPFELPPLPYAFEALEPYIDAKTVEIHYTKHHATYLKNVNTALEKHPELAELSLVALLKDLDKVPEDIRTAVHNNGGGVFNHNFYWANLGPGKGGELKGAVAKAISARFGDFAAFKAEIEKTGLGRLGSGYAFLCCKPDKSLVVHATLNQDTPLAEGLVPLLVIDVWEHAYYLKYQNRRAEYLTNIWNLIDWDVVESRYKELG
jgi:Fe-Mn family superoxide dismutase